MFQFLTKQFVHFRITAFSIQIMRLVKARFNIADAKHFPLPLIGQLRVIEMVGHLIYKIANASFFLLEDGNGGLVSEIEEIDEGGTFHSFELSAVTHPE